MGDFRHSSGSDQSPFWSAPLAESLPHPPRMRMESSAPWDPERIPGPAVLGTEGPGTDSGASRHRTPNGPPTHANHRRHGGGTRFANLRCEYWLADASWWNRSHWHDSPAVSGCT